MEIQEVSGEDDVRKMKEALGGIGDPWRRPIVCSCLTMKHRQGPVPSGTTIIFICVIAAKVGLSDSPGLSLLAGDAVREPFRDHQQGFVFGYLG